MEFPGDLKYTKEHEWVRIDGDAGTIGITDFAQGELGDVVFVDLPSVGAALSKDATFGTIEAVKAVSDLYAPLTGEVVEVNAALSANPELVNKSPYTDGWMIRIKVSNADEVGSLLDAAAYQALTGK